MDLHKPIEFAPKNGDFIVLLDATAGAWEVGRWDDESNRWIQLDGRPLRIFPTHWVPVSGNAAGYKNADSLSFLIPSIDTGQERTRAPFFLLAFIAVAAFIGGNASGWYAISAFRSELATTAQLKGEPERQLESERGHAHRVAELVAARERENVATANVVETERVADAGPTDMKQALDPSVARTEESSSELESYGKNATLVGKPLEVTVVAQEGASHISSLNGPNDSHAAPEIAGSISETSVNGVTSSPDGGIAGSSRSLAWLRDLKPASAPPSADETRLIARAESLIHDFDFAGARLLLEHAIGKGSAQAALLMAETYDWRVLRSGQAHGVRGDAEKARKFYELAAAAGIEKARERLEALISSSNP